MSVVCNLSVCVCCSIRDVFGDVHGFSGGIAEQTDGVWKCRDGGLAVPSECLGTLFNAHPFLAGVQELLTIETVRKLESLHIYQRL